MRKLVKLILGAALLAACTHFAVHVLADDQAALSDHFAVHGRFVFDAPSRSIASGTFPFVEFFAGDDEREDFVCNLALEDGLDIDLGSLPECGEAELVSLRLHDVPAGRVIRLHDRPRSTGAGSWTELVPKRFIASRRFGPFEINLDDGDFRASRFGAGGLAGRIWRIEVSAVPPADLASAD